MKKKILLIVLCMVLVGAVVAGIVYIPSFFKEETAKGDDKVDKVITNSVLTDGVQRFLCWDEEIISENNGISIVQHNPQKQNIALECDDEWEGVHNGYTQVIKVDDGYRMYYRAWGQNGFVHKDPNKSDNSVICVATSKDGKTFTKPNVGKIEYNGSTDNNIVYRSSSKNVDTFTVFYDPNPNCDPKEKYKALARDQGTNILDYYISEDGYEFNYMERIILNGTFDSFNAVLWDDDKQQYIMYYRGYHRKDGSNVDSMSSLDETNDIRDIRMAVSKDFRTWEFVDYLTVKDQPSNVQLYTNQIVNYYREKGTFVGFPMRYTDRVNEKENYDNMAYAKEREGIIAQYGRGGTAVTDTGIMTSHDGINFKLSNTSFIKPGFESGNDWWYGGNFSGYGLIETTSDTENAPNEISFYMGENYRIENVDFRRYTIRLDGFFSWYGDGKGAEVETRPFVLQKGNMSLNFATSASGSIEIEILDKNGKVIEGYKSGVIFGNSVNRSVKFQKDLKDLVGKEIKIKFKMNDCNLYSFAFE